MKKLLNLLLAMLVIVGVACTTDNGENEKNGGNTNTTFAIEVMNVTPIGARVLVVPSDNAATYYFDVVSKAQFEKDYDANTNAKKILSNLKASCEQMGYTIADVLSTGVDEYCFGGFTPTTEYYALAFGVTTDGAISTEVAIVPFKTLEEVVDADMTFNVSVSDVTSNSASVAVTPSNSDATYYFDVVPKEELGRYADEEAYAKELIASIKEYNESQGINLSLNLSVGVNEYLFKEGTTELIPNTDYCAFAFGVTTEGTITTEVTTVPFKTLE